MPAATEAFPSVEFRPEFDGINLELHQNLGFYTLSSSEVMDPATLVLLGFGTPRNSDGEFDSSDSVVPVTNFNDLHSSDQNIDFLGKGVGPRMYNTPHAALGLTELRSDEIGAYAFHVHPADLHDTRATEGNKLARIGRHGLRMIKSKFGSLEDTVEAVHHSYGDASAVLFTQPPHAAMRQAPREEKLRKANLLASPPEGVPAEFMIIRDASILLYRVGSQHIV